MPKVKKKWSGKAKGSAFELYVVKEIRKAVSKRFQDEICYRTPRSGGHPIIGGADIIIKPRLRKYFNYAVECKHQKTIKVNKLFDIKKQIRSFLDQTVANTFEGDDYPLLVLRGHATPVFCASKTSAFKKAGYERLVESSTPGLMFLHKGKEWKMFLFKFLMIELKRKIKESMNGD